MNEEQKMSLRSRLRLARRDSSNTDAIDADAIRDGVRKAFYEAIEKKVKESKHSPHLPLGAKKLDLLREAFTTFQLENTFKVGDIVRWKNGMKNRLRPAYSEPAIVIEFNSSKPALLNEKGSETPYFREPLDLQLGLLDKDGDFVIYYFDSRRFQPWSN